MCKKGKMIRVLLIETHIKLSERNQEAVHGNRDNLENRRNAGKQKQNSEYKEN